MHANKSQFRMWNCFLSCSCAAILCVFFCSSCFVSIRCLSFAATPVCLIFVLFFPLSFFKSTIGRNSDVSLFTFASSSEIVYYRTFTQSTVCVFVWQQTSSKCLTCSTPNITSKESCYNTISLYHLHFAHFLTRFFFYSHRFFFLSFFPFS